MDDNGRGMKKYERRTSWQKICALKKAEVEKLKTQIDPAHPWIEHIFGVDIETFMKAFSSLVVFVIHRHKIKYLLSNFNG